MGLLEKPRDLHPQGSESLLSAFPDPILLWGIAQGHVLKTKISSFPTTRISSFLDSPELSLHLSQSDPESPALFLLRGAEVAQRQVLTKTLIGYVLHITPHQHSVRI